MMRMYTKWHEVLHLGKLFEDVKTRPWTHAHIIPFQRDPERTRCCDHHLLAWRKPSSRVAAWSLQLLAPGMFCAKHETFWISKNATCENSRGGLKRGYTSHWSKWLFTIIIAIGNHKSDLLCYALSLGSTRLVSQMLFMAGIHEAYVRVFFSAGFVVIGTCSKHKDQAYQAVWVFNLSTVTTFSRQPLVQRLAQWTWR